MANSVPGEIIATISSPIGFVVLNWAFVEQYMSSIVESTHEAVVDAGLIGERPGQFSDKKAYLEKVFSRLEGLAEYRPEWSAILTALDLIMPIRHAYAHGTIGAYDAATGAITFQKVNPAKSKDHHTIKDVVISLKNIEIAADVIGKVTDDLGNLALRIMDKFETTE